MAAPGGDRGSRLKASVMVCPGFSKKNKDGYLQGKEGGRDKSLSSFTELVVFETSDGGRNKEGLKPVK